jgi:hypothetical protein
MIEQLNTQLMPSVKRVLSYVKSQTDIAVIILQQLSEQGGSMNNLVVWVFLENIITLICACVCAYFISPWCFLLLLNLNSFKSKAKEL